MLLQPPPAGAQAGLLQFQIGGPQQHCQRLGLGAAGAGEGQGQAHQVGGGGHGLQLAGQHGIQQAHRQQAAAHATTQQLHIDGVGEVAQAARQGQLHAVHPAQHPLRILGKPPRLPEGILLERILGRLVGILTAVVVLPVVLLVVLFVVRIVLRSCVGVWRGGLRTAQGPPEEGSAGQGRGEGDLHRPRWQGLRFPAPGLPLPGEFLQQLLPFMTVAPLALPGDLGRQDHQLLHREQAAAATHQVLDLAVQEPAAVNGELAVALGVDLGGEMEAGLADLLGQHLAQHLEVQGNVAVELRVRLAQPLCQGLELTRQIDRIGQVAQRLRLSPPCPSPPLRRRNPTARPRCPRRGCSG